MIKIIIITMLLTLMGCQLRQPEHIELYQQLGGDIKIAALVKNFLQTLQQDQRIGGLFEEIDEPSTRAHLADFICQLAGGGCDYQGLSLYEAHIGLEITAAEFDHFVNLFIQSMQQVEVPYQAQNKLLALMAALRPEILSESK